MLYDQDIVSIKNAAERTLENNCVGFNNSIDMNQLLSAISAAIAEALKEYDQLRGK